MRYLLPLLGCALVSTISPAKAQAEQPALKRFALIAAASNGGKGRDQLRYATTDAEALANVLQDLGALSRENTIFLREPSPEAFMEGFDRIQKKLLRSNALRKELIVYYSGHSDEQGILLGEEQVSYRAFRKRLEGTSADVRIAILDSCSSGALTRRKGGKMRPPLELDQSSEVRGFAFLTSASADEAAQESDRIQASFFTHALVSALRGAADTTGDGRVTLNEAYAFAFHETLAHTEKTLSGPQHPNYDIQLVGSGDLVLTNVRGTGAGLLLEPQIQGRLYLRDNQGKLVAELSKAQGTPIELGLPAGVYTAVLEHQDQRRETKVVLEQGQQATLGSQGWSSFSPLANRTRGNKEVAEEVEQPIDHVPVNLSLLPALSLTRNRRTLNNFSLGLLYSSTTILRGLALGLGPVRTEEDTYGIQATVAMTLTGRNFVGVQASVGGNIVEGEGKGIQTATGFNYVGENFKGLQQSTGANLVYGRMQGIQTTVGFNSAEIMQGIQLSAGANIATNEAVGIQTAAGINFAKEAKGLQLAAGINYSHEFLGLQTGMVNVASGKMRGFQLGLVNYGGKGKGLQLGLINISEEFEGVPLGLINIVAKNGYLKPTVWANEVATLSGGLKMGTKSFYTILAVGTKDFDGANSGSISVGIGSHFNVNKKFFIDAEFLDVMGVSENTDDVANVLSLRATLGYRITDWLSAYGGPSLNLMTDKDPQENHRWMVPDYASSIGSHAAWVGGTVGVQIL